MKSDFHFHFYSRIVIMAVFAVSLILIQKSVTSNAEINADPYPIGGWAWSESAGWLSLNCYNDFVTPGEYRNDCGVAAWPGNENNYSLEVYSTGNVEGCIWAGNLLSGGSSVPLGWVCFSDQLTGEGPESSDGFGVTTSTSHLNALDPNTFASIIAQENWKCVGTTDGLNDGDSCLKADQATDCPGGTCDFTDDGAWQLGFPIFSDVSVVNPVDLPSEPNPIEGCFNCYEEAIAACEENTDGGSSIDCAVGADIDQAICDDAKEWRCSGNLDVECSGSNDSICQDFTDWGTCTYDAIPHGLCIQSDIDYYCENCLEYFYYPGRCELPGEIPDTPATHGTHTQCSNSDDCISTETCQSISTCSLNIEQDCKNSPVSCTGGAVNCILRETGSLKKLIGAYDCSECSIASYDNACGINAYQGNINSCEACEEAYYSPGVMLDHNYYNLDVSIPEGDKAGLCGWAWNAWEDGGPTYGLGWFQFGPRVVTSTKPYLSVDGGSIYSKGDIKGRYIPPFGHYNASYLIESGGSITNFISDSTLVGTYQGEFAYRPSINFLEHSVVDEKYSNVLGSVDYYGLTEDYGDWLNKYGAKINPDQSDNLSNIIDIFSDPLGDEVYLFADADLDIAAGLTVFAGDPYPGISAGSGVMIIEGDLSISNNIRYEADPTITNLRNIPSLVWIVLGDLKIDSAVSELAGTFIVLGNNASPDNPPCSGDPIEDHCGQIITCSSNPTSCGDNPLIIQGSVLARYFDLGRTYVDVDDQAAEKFVNDGRLQANPPSGFEDFSKLIPRFTEN